MAFYQIDQDKNYMREMWGTSKLNNDNDKEKTWFLRPEQAIFNDIKNLNFDKIEKKLKL